MAKEQINLHELEGKWHVILTNFPMWLKGDKKKKSEFQLQNGRKRWCYGFNR